MKLEHDWCYNALKSRDVRFDARFSTGVITTGVYCRPICPALTPQSQNVRFYPTAAAAEDAGFRPCLRCRPESSPGTPEWIGSSSIVSRALRLISEGTLDEFGVDGLAGRLHVGSRHLRRLFVEHIGASPMAVAQNRRIAFAKKLIDETRLSMAEIAFSSGFGSIRRFNDAFRKMYGRPPTSLRRTGSTQTVKQDKNGSNLNLKLYYRPPYDHRSILDFLKARAVPAMESVAANTYRRSIKIGPASGILEVSLFPEKNFLRLTVPNVFSPSLIQIVEKVRRIFDLRADTATIGAVLKKDAPLAGLVEKRPGLRVPGAWDEFEIAVRTILGQQVSVKAARTLCGRLVRRWGEPLSNGENRGTSDIRYSFPPPEILAEADLSGLGLVRTRAAAINRLATAVCEAEVSLKTASALEEAVDALSALPGIGPWTSQYIAMRALGETDAFPAGDLGLLQAIKKIEGTAVTEKQLEKWAESWRPWRAYAAMYLWNSLASENE